MDKGRAVFPGFRTGHLRVTTLKTPDGVLMEGDRPASCIYDDSFPTGGSLNTVPFSENFSSTHFAKESKWVCQTKLVSRSVTVKHGGAHPLWHILP